jgi:hypothetical protein
LRLFAQGAGVSARGCSRRLQRVLTDLGADLPYAQVMDKPVEHYGVVMAESTIRCITLAHAQHITAAAAASPKGCRPQPHRHGPSSPRSTAPWCPPCAAMPPKPIDAKARQRLKLPGAWCTAANAEHMLALRVNRTNVEWDGEWDAYWNTNLRYVRL